MNKQPPLVLNVALAILKELMSQKTILVADQHCNKGLG